MKRLLTFLILILFTVIVVMGSEEALASNRTVAAQRMTAQLFAEVGYPLSWPGCAMMLGTERNRPAPFERPGHDTRRNP